MLRLGQSPKIRCLRWLGPWSRTMFFLDCCHGIFSQNFNFLPILSIEIFTGNSTSFCNFPAKMWLCVEMDWFKHEWSDYKVPWDFGVPNFDSFFFTGRNLDLGAVGRRFFEALHRPDGSRFGQLNWKHKTGVAYWHSASGGFSRTPHLFWFHWKYFSILF